MSSEVLKSQYDMGTNEVGRHRTGPRDPVCHPSSASGKEPSCRNQKKVSNRGQLGMRDGDAKKGALLDVGPMEQRLKVLIPPGWGAQPYSRPSSSPLPGESSQGHTRHTVNEGAFSRGSQLNPLTSST